MPLKPLARFLAEPGGAQVHHLHDTGLELTSGTRRRPHQQCECLLSSALSPEASLFRRSRDERHQREVGPLSRGVISPEGSTPIRSCYRSGLRFLPPSSTRRPLGNPLAAGLPRKGGRRAYHVPRMYQGWFRLCLSAGGSDSDGRGRETPLHLGHVTFWFKPLSAFGLLDLTTFISSSPGLAMPSTLAPNRLRASSRRALSREARPPWVGEVTLSQELAPPGHPGRTSW